MESLSFSQVDLASALALVSRVRPWQRDIKKPALIRVVAESGQCTLTSSSLEMQIEVTSACEGSAAEFVVPLDTFSAFAKKAPGAISITASDEGVVARSGRTRCTLQANPADAPPLRAKAAGSTHVIQSAALVDCLGAAVPATGDDKAQPHLGGVNIRGTDSGIVFAAQDGNRLHVAAQDGKLLDDSIVVPWRSVDTILAVLTRDGAATVAADRSRVTVVAGAVTITSTLIEGAYPSIDSRAAPTTDRELQTKADSLLSVIDLVMTVADHRDRDFRLDLGPSCEASTFRKNGDAGACTFDAAFHGAPVAIGFQYEPVRDALALFGSDTIRWRMGGAEDPTIITCDERPGVQAIVSPYRLLPDHQRKAA